ncbi:SLATT domain-containing protein [Cronobacter sakazakii]|uniref:SLATT domain-containing protein n=1 Tax=Cronobacter sakazakii TaxID=28141 RepID=UPI000CFAE017|nr:SLATT domain-containing protein [Cronobacter sakazakii]ELY4099888.1 SLATT domain-containing protein [Cronobacter sakazakii]ELY4873046.1 SLATT domain-containing protein [Cronobacter sakazakii]ELY5911277.1 SLATT domain-containing protein [Cronobacter sakazakii]MDT3550607.1 SLATT domain-containing protein [Cronobacter sakazakii]NCI09195.1 SLATT domain-containing protein [Cronobacter sakazakii]
MRSTFSDKVWWTRKAKIKAERRLLNQDYYSQFLLLWYSSFLVCYSIYSLVKPPANDNESIIMVALSVLILALTLFINNMNYKGRAMLIKQCYEKLSVIYTLSLNCNDLTALDKEYQSILASSENHLERDFIKAMVDEYSNTSDKTLLTKHPTNWHRVQVVYHIIVNVAIFLALLVFPLVILFVLREAK